MNTSCFPKAEFKKKVPTLSHIFKGKNHESCCNDFFNKKKTVYEKQKTRRVRPPWYPEILKVHYFMQE